jgi:putative copper resistance protein D
MQFSHNLIVLIHVLAAILWLGGMFFIGLVMVPVLRDLEPPQKRIEVLSSAAKRFRTLSWIAIPVLLITGVLNAMNRGVTLEMVSNGSLFLSYFGKILTIKVAIVLSMLILGAIHDFVLGPRLTDIMAGTSSGIYDSEKIKTYRVYVSWLARFNALLGISVVALAVMLS